MLEFWMAPGKMGWNRSTYRCDAGTKDSRLEEAERRTAEAIRVLMGKQQ